jgi:acyl carrier protein
LAVIACETEPKTNLLKENSLVSNPEVNAKGENVRNKSASVIKDSQVPAATSAAVKEGQGGSTSTATTVEERVIDIVCENLGVNKEQVTRQTSFIEDIGADSLDIVELVMELEEEFEITIPDDQAEQIKTVGEAIDYIEREQAKK